MVEDFNYFQILLLSIAASLFFFIIVSVFVLLSVFDGRGFITPSISVSGAAMIGAGLGFIHGLIMGLFLIWRRSDSVINALMGSVLATEIISILICVILLLINIKDNLSSSAEPMSFSDYVSSFINIIIVFSYASLVLLVPGVVIGLINRLIFYYFR